MREELQFLDQLNPVPDSEASGWRNTDEGERTFARVLERTEDDIGDLEKIRPRMPERRPWVVAIAAALVVVAAVGLPALLRGSGSEPAAFSLALDVEYVWPEGGFAGDPEEVAREFASTLGWTGVNTSVDPNPNTDGRVWVFIQQPGSEHLPVLTIPVGEGLRALEQIGPPNVSIGTNGHGAGDSHWIALTPVLDATLAEVHIRLVGSEETDVIEIPSTERRVSVEDIYQIASVLVVYRDEAGQVVTASGTQFGTIKTTEPRTSQEILADDAVTESEYRQAASAVLTCVNEAGAQAELEFNAQGYASFTTLDSVESTFNRCYGQHLSGIDLAWADHNAPYPEREAAFYNDVVSCVEARTGKDYGTVEAAGDTRATDAAIADAPDLYNTCFERTITRYPQG